MPSTAAAKFSWRGNLTSTSPFGTRRRMTVYVQKTIYGLREIYINAGHRGILVAMAPAGIDTVLAGLTVPVDVAIPG